MYMRIKKPHDLNSEMIKSMHVKMDTRKEDSGSSHFSISLSLPKKHITILPGIRQANDVMGIQIEVLQANHLKWEGR